MKLNPSEMTSWEDAALAATLFAIDPTGIKGINLRAQPGPVRDEWMRRCRDYFSKSFCWKRVPLNISDCRLLGGLDLPATLTAGKPVAEKGILAEADGGIIILSMAERLPIGTAATIANCLDCGEVVLERDGLANKTPTQFSVIALDEGIHEDESTSSKLQERFAFHVELENVSYQESTHWSFSKHAVNKARKCLPAVSITNDMLELLCAAAMGFGITSLRAPLLARNVARALAALEGNQTVSKDNALLACRLVYAHRALYLPAEIEEEAEAQQPEQTPEQNESEQDQQQQNNEQQQFDPQSLEELLIEATQAVLSKQLLEKLQSTASKNNQKSQSGRSSNLKYSDVRGRPVGVRKGEPGNGARLNVLETLRAAAPWQRIRNNVSTTNSDSRRIDIQREDFRIARFKQRTVTTTIFVVDASGSSALNRLAEAKGAVELLLAECYQRRDQVALIAFRGKQAEVLLPPTRSLVRAKRSLAGLPGGGATPLASGIDAALLLAQQIKQQGETPTIILLTDGRTNINREGEADRSTAETDALLAAKEVRMENVSSLLIDTSPRKQPFNQQVAEQMGAQYLAMPHANSQNLSEAVLAHTSSKQSMALAS